MSSNAAHSAPRPLKFRVLHPCGAVLIFFNFLLLKLLVRILIYYFSVPQVAFDHWNHLKKELNLRSRQVFFAEREIWWCSLGKNIGHEQDGKNAMFERPILILTKFNNRIFLAIPLTTKLKTNQFYHHFIFKDQARSAIISQIRLLDMKRLHRKVGTVSLDDFQIIKQKIVSLI